MTLQIQRPPETTQNLSTIPTVQNSLNLVRNLMGTTLGAITYLRGLFPEKNYKDTKMGGLTLKKIARNYSDEADELMNWLEQGCFDALEKQYLKTMIFGIYTSENEPDKLLEAYTFGFSYPAKDKWCISIDANGKNAFKVKTKGEIMKATTELLRRLLILTQTLSALPPQAYITMKLFYYDETTPEDYEPPYFRAGDDDEKFYFAHRPEKIRVGQIETPHHALNMHVQTASDMEPAADDMALTVHATPFTQAMGAASAEDEDSTMSETNAAMEMENFVKREEDVVIIPPEPSLRVSMSQEAYTSTSQLMSFSNADTQGEPTQDLAEMLRADVKRGMEKSKRNMYVIDDDEEEDRQAGDDLMDIDDTIGNSVADMDQVTPAKPIKKASPIQIYDGASDSSIDLSVADPKETTMDEVEEMTKVLGETTLSVLDDAHMSQANSLTASDQAPIGKKDERRVSPSLAAGDEDSDNDDDEGSITCPCGIEKEDLDMVCCSRCKNWAHCACYGFTSATDKSIPKILLCFTCQNEDAKGTMGQGQGKPLYNMDRISEIALFRRGLHIAWDSGVPSATRFSKLLGVNVAQTRQIITRLQTEGFLVENKSKAKAKRGRPSASADDDQTTHQYLVVKNKKSIAHFQKWNGDFGLAAAVVNPYTSLAMETQRQFSANAKATPARSDVLPEIVGTRETDSTARDVLPTPPQTTKKASMRQTTPVPSTPKRVTRALSRSLSVSLFSDDEDNAKLGMSSPPPTHKESKIFTIPDTPHRMTRSMSRAMSASLSDEENGGHGKTLMPATPSKSRLRSATPDCVNLIDSPRKTLKKEFLEKFGEASQRQMTGFLPSSPSGKSNSKKRMSHGDLDDAVEARPARTPAGKGKKRKVSVAKRGIAVL